MFMYRFHRYVLWEIFKPFSIALIAITTLVMMVLVVERAVVEQLGLFSILRLIPYIIPLSLQYSLPATLLFAVCSVYGRMAADNEIIAIKSSGISPVRIVIPTLVLAFIISPVAVWLNDVSVTWGRPGVNHVVMHSLEEILYRVLRTNRYYSTPKGFSICVKDVEDRWLKAPVITLFSQSGGEPEVITADQARISLDAEKESLVIELEDYQMSLGKVQFRKGGRDILEIPLDRARRKGDDAESPAQYPMFEIGAEAKQERKRLVSHEDNLSMRYSSAMALGRVDLFNDGPSLMGRFQREHSQKRLYKLQVEPWRRWALGFSCFFFAWMGVPLAIRMKSADYMMTFGACFLPILLLYFPLFGLGLDRAKEGVWPAYSVWLGNGMLLIVGAWLLRKVYKS